MFRWFIVVLGAILILVFCRAATPTITQGIDVSDRVAAIQAMNTRLKTEFPVGSSAKKLNDALREDGFLVRIDGGQIAEFTSGFICPAKWSIRWESDGTGKIADVQADWDNPCY